MAQDLKLIQDLNKRIGLLKTERSTWWMQWKDLSQFILPYNGRFFNSDRDRGWKRFNSIYDNSATRANRILAAGMMSGASSPSRPWFKLSLHDKDLMRFHPVKDWLATVTDLIAQALVNSNTYRVLPMLYGEMGVFGTASALIADDYKNVIHLHPFTVGEYCIETDWKGDVVTIYREFDKTVGAIVSEFGYSNCSKTLQNQFDRGQLDIWYTVRHAVEPRSDRDHTKIDGKNMAWRSVYWEMSNADGHMLRESGYKSFPCVCPRWQVMGGDIYGNSPGMETLGDVKQLQAQQFRKSQAIDYQANPPLQVPSDMKNREMEIFPGGISYYDAATPQQGIRTAFEVNLNLQTLLEDLQDIRGRINNTFFVDIFLAITDQSKDMTAYEVAARKTEQMLMLGPVVERVTNELLTPLLETTFERMLAGGLLPPPPEELSGHNLNIEYISVLAQAQKAVAINSISQFVSELGQIATIKPDVLDKFDADKWADIAADMLGIPPDLLVTDRNLALIRQQKAQQAQQAQMAAMLEQGANIMNKAGSTPTQPGSAGGDMLQALQAQAASRGGR
ncbi:portal protein [Methylomonas montana]|uniref:portal protein n=1 Tax=Methylomonas montana TaxID=3058963 RepID=UPI00265921BD|nr:portal protein [Methylomonas montana]WKJ88767.1 portal protein [Methylomonas montana]